MPSVNEKVAILEERVSNHIKFFWVVVAFGFAWLGAITVLVYHTNTTVGRVEKAQADAPTRIVAGLLNNLNVPTAQMTVNLEAVSTVLQNSRVGRIKPDRTSLKTVADKISDVQRQYPDLIQAWQATGAFIGYKSEAIAPDLSKVLSVANHPSCEERMDPDGWTISNCETSLEDVALRIRNTRINGKPATFKFVNCIMHYSGGPLPGYQLTFYNCILRFQVQTVPSREAMIAMQQLTTSESDKLSISLG
ncbi:MAG TPA: hypothetical protein VII95_08175 [Terriglobales bacterium]